MTDAVTRQLDDLRANIGAHGSALVAFSAGVDSTVVLKIAADVLGERALGLVGTSPSLAPDEARDAERLARSLGARVEFAPTQELDDPRYVANANDRCFFCKTELYDVCQRAAREYGLAVILNGTNADDPADWRPGLAAAREAGVCSPLLECGLSKSDVRAVARRLRLPNWDKPALACLASRLPYGTPVTVERLRAVDAVERHLRSLGYRQVRARHRGEEVELEVEPERVADLLRHDDDPEFRLAVRKAGFRRFRIMKDGYRQGRLNHVPP